MYWMGENLVSVSNGHVYLHIIKYAGCAVNTSQGILEYGETIVAFDGYNETSTKDMTHQRWAGERTAETVTFEESKPVTMKKVPQNSAKKATAHHHGNICLEHKGSQTAAGKGTVYDIMSQDWGWKENDGMLSPVQIGLPPAGPPIRHQMQLQDRLQQPEMHMQEL